MRRILLIVGLLTALAAMPALALDPPRSFDQFVDTAWTLENGAPTNIRALAQTPDGYLWIGALKGLYRFDGITFKHIPAFQGGPARSDSVTALLAAKNGELWVGHSWGGLSVLHDGQLKDVNPAPPYGVVYRIAQTSDGAIWSAVNSIRLAGLRRYLDGQWENINAGERGLPTVELSDILAARDGSLWVALIDRVVRLRPGARNFELVSDEVRDASALAEDTGGRIWVLDARGIWPLGEIPSKQDPGPQKGNSAEHGAGFITDRQGSLWAADQRMGLVRAYDPEALARGTPGSAAQKFAPKDEASFGLPATVFDDREDNIWIGTNSGLHRLRDGNIATYANSSSPAGIGGQHFILLPVEGDGFYAMWDHSYAMAGLGRTPQLRLNRQGAWSDLSNLAAGAATACVGRDGAFWIVNQDGLNLIKDQRPVKLIPWSQDLKDGVIVGCKLDKLNRIWVSKGGGGLYRFDGHSWSHFVVAPEVENVVPYAWTEDPQGRLLVYYGTRSLFRIDGDRVETVLPKSEIDIHFLNAIYCNGDRIVLGGEGGLMVSDGGVFKTLSANRFPFLAHVAGITETSSGTVWIISAAGLARLTKKDFDHALEDQNAILEPRIFDFHDGLRGEAQENGDNGLIEDGNGRIWIATTTGLASIDPQHLHQSRLPPPVLLRSVQANGQEYKLGSALTLPAGLNRLQIDYTATDLTAPDRTRFRYRLEGVDKNWVEAGTQRQAVYTNLVPGDYRFTAIAANDDGVWNTSGASSDLRIPPTFMQSKTFLSLCAVLVVALLSLAYRLRMKQVSDRLLLRHEERTAERERIARELHDTLLQSVQGLIFRFQAAISQVPRANASRALMEQALDRADEVVAEARDRVTQLRRADIDGTLPQILETSADRILTGSQIGMHLATEGVPRGMSPMAGEELVKIAEEFLTNTLRHSTAQNVDIHLIYGRRSFVLRLCDDGQGIDLGILERGGRTGHFGLAGMRERAQKVGAVFDLTSRPGEGVRLSLKIPATLAYIKKNRSEKLPIFHDVPNAVGN